VQAGAARGLVLRMDNGSGISKNTFEPGQVLGHSFAFVKEPETNPVVERFYRTLNEQVIYGRTFVSIEDVRAAMAILRRQYHSYGW
jgi:putative transposase